MAKKIAIFSLISAVVLLGATLNLYFKGSAKEEKISSLSNEVDELRSELKEREERISELNAQLNRLKFKKAFDQAPQENPSSNFRNLPSKEDGKANDDSLQDSVAENEKPKTRRQRMREQALRRSVDASYSELFEELALPDSAKEKLKDHLASSIEEEAKLSQKLFDSSVSVDEIMQMQSKFVQRNDQGLGEILQSNEVEKTKDYQKNLAKKMQREHLLQMTDSMGLEGPEQENIKSALESAIESLPARNRIGQLTRQEIVEMKKNFAGSKPGDEKFLRATKKMAEEDTQNLIQKLQPLLSPEELEKIREPLEMPVKMMEQGLRMQQQRKQNGNQ